MSNSVLNLHLMMTVVNHLHLFCNIFESAHPKIIILIVAGHFEIQREFSMIFGGNLGISLGIFEIQS